MRTCNAILILISLAFWASRATCQESFEEEAVVSPLPDGLVLVHVHFTQQAAYRRHYALFPKAVGQLAAAIPFEGLELSLTQGRWHYHRWGEPLLQAKPSGAELRAAFSPSLPPDALPALWGNLSHALGGLFCASLNFVARPEATVPQAITMMQQHTPQQQQPGCSTAGGGSGGSSWVPQAEAQHVLYAALPQEASCTENLTPWLKLLPCRDAAGIGQLLARRDVVFGADYHSLQVLLQVQRDAQQRPLHTTLTQTFTMVLRVPADEDGSGLSPARRPPQLGSLSDIDLAGLMGLGGPAGLAACPVAQTSRLHVRLPALQLQEVDLEQEQQQQQQWAMQLPAYTAGDAPPAVPDEDNSGGTGGVSGDASTEAAAAAEEDGGSSPQGHARRPGRRRTRAVSWVTPAFTLQPAPDAAAVLQHPDSGGEPAAAAAAAAPVLYTYDLLQDAAGHDVAAAAAAADGAEGQPGAPFSLSWHPEWPGMEAGAQLPADAAAASSSSSAAGPTFAVSRYLTGTGNLHGGMVLQLQAVGPPASHAAGQAWHSFGAGQQQPGEVLHGGSSISVCIFQLVPWYIRLWLHTLELRLDGQAVNLEDVMLLSHISPAEDRKRPLVLDLCLAVPTHTRSIILTAQFTKAFLMMLEHPPDAHRGFDVPSAIITVGGTHTPPQPPTQQTHMATGPTAGGDSGTTSGSSSASSGGAGACGDAAGGSGSDRRRAWHVVVAEGAARQEQLQRASPLMQQIMQPRPRQVYSPGLVVPLAVPDFSMPYNVICLTSTVLAVFVGGVLNALLWRPGKEERDAADPEKARKRRSRKLVRLVVLVVLFVGLAVHWDPELQAEIQKQLHALGLMGAPLPDQAGGADEG